MGDLNASKTREKSSHTSRGMGVICSDIAVWAYIRTSRSTSGYTLVYLIVVPALMQNLDSEDGDMESFLTCCSKLKYWKSKL